MLKIILITLLPVLGLVGEQILSHQDPTPQGPSGTLEKMIVASGNVSMDLDFSRLSGKGQTARPSTIRFDAEHDSFFTIIVFNGELRGPLPGSMRIIQTSPGSLPGKLNGAQLVLENEPW